MIARIYSLKFCRHNGRKQTKKKTKIDEEDEKLRVWIGTMYENAPKPTYGIPIRQQQQQREEEEEKKREKIKMIFLFVVFLCAAKDSLLCKS